MDNSGDACRDNCGNTQTALMKDVKGKNIVIIGAAKSGVASARLLKSGGANVFVTDSGNIPEFWSDSLEKAGIPYEAGGHSERAKAADFVVISPGVPTEAPLVQHYLNSGRAVFSEIEAASWFNSGRIIGITGSNGKTTTTAWLADMWKRAGREAKVGGNIGVAFSEFADQTGTDCDVILEISSFQLDHIDTFRPAVSAILNITPDHLNRYNNQFERYAQSKMRIMENQRPEDFFVYNFDDPVLKHQVSGVGIRPDGPQMIPFSMLDEVSRGAYVRNGTIILNLDEKEEPLMKVAELGLKGSHNLGNGLAAAIVARSAEISNDSIRESLSGFEGVEHRLEQVRILNGVRYVNDSKATNINSVWFALQSFQCPVVLILGGRDKGNDYTQLSDQLREKAHTIVAIGEARDKIEEQIGDTVPYFYKTDTMEEAVALSYRQAKKGEVVLLSPACASFDMFESYEHRGEVFKSIVNKLG